MYLSNEKYDIIVLGGQSNAEGWGFGDTDNEYKEDGRIEMLVDKHHVAYVKDENGKDVLDFEYPLQFEIKPANEDLAGDKKIGNFFIWFAKEYAEKYLEKGRKVLIVKSAVGGTGFKRQQWRIGDPLQVRMELMVKTALKLNKENKIVAFLWHQGECDAIDFATAEGIGEYYERQFTAFINRFRKKFKCNVPIIAGGYVDELKKEEYGFTEKLLRLEQTFKSLSEKDDKIYFVNSEGLRANKNCFEGGDQWHFCRPDLELLGKRYFETYEKAINK